MHEANPNALQASFLSNHDIDRPAAYLAYKENRIKFAQGLQMMINGASFIYYVVSERIKGEDNRYYECDLRLCIKKY